MSAATVRVAVAERAAKAVKTAVAVVSLLFEGRKKREGGGGGGWGCACCGLRRFC